MHHGLPRAHLDRYKQLLSGFVILFCSAMDAHKSIVGADAGKDVCLEEVCI